MEYHHLALSINCENDIQDFYIDVLGMKLIHSFEINKNLSSIMFNIDDSFPVFMMQKNEVKIEIFLNDYIRTPNFSHLCVSVSNREDLVEEAKNRGYKTNVIKREKGDLIFIYDKSGNPFEIKQS